MALSGDNLGSSKAVLLDQNNRIEKHRTNFETLKGEFLNIQRVHDKLTDEHAELSRNYIQMTEKSEEVIRKLQQERDRKIMECEHLRAEVLTPSQMVDLKEAISTEAGDMYRKQLDSLEAELQVLRSDHRKICKNYEYLQTEHEALQVTYENQLKETKRRLQNEISRYRERCSELSSQLERDIPSEIQRTRHLQRENAKLTEQISGLQLENEQLKSQLEDTDTVRDQHILGLKQQISDLQASLDQLSNDKASLRSRNKHLQDEVESQVQQYQMQSQEVIDCQRQGNVWKRKYEDCLHEHAREIDSLRRNNIQELQKCQEERRSCIEEMEQCKLQNETQEMTIRQLESAISEKDKELSAAVEKAVETEWQRRVEVEKERMALEEKLTELQRLILTRSEEYDKMVSDLKEELSSLHTEKSLNGREMDSLRNELKQQKVLDAQLSKDQLELKELRSQVTSFVHEKCSLEESVRQLEEDKEKLVTHSQILTQQVQSLHSEVNETQETSHRDMEKFRSELEEERISWKQRIDDASSQKKALQEKLHSTKKEKAKLQKQHKRSVQEVQKLLELAYENEKQAIQEKDQIRKSADEDIKSLKQQLKSVRKQHQQFLMLISTSPDIPYSRNLSTLDSHSEHSTVSLDRDL